MAEITVLRRYADLKPVATPGETLWSDSSV